MFITIFIICVIYLLLYLFLIFKFTIEPSGKLKNITAENSQKIKFSIIVAAKNEEENIQKLISALKDINYDKENYEVIIVDDHSTDNTVLNAEKLTADINNIRVVKYQNKFLNGKREALDYGISLASFPFILITDADCVLGKDWLSYYANVFQNDYDFVIGIAPFYQSRLLVNKISCFENFRATLLFITAANSGSPYTASARNFGFKKKSFEKIAGYRNTTDTLSGDDDLLLREAVKNKLKISTLTSSESFAYSETKKSFKEYLLQRARHTQASFHYLFKHKLFLSIWHILNISFILSPVLIAVDTIFILPFFTKLILDLITTIICQKKLGYKFSLFEIIYLQISYEIFLIVHFFNAKLGRISWK